MKLGEKVKMKIISKFRNILLRKNKEIKIIKAEKENFSPGIYKYKYNGKRIYYLESELTLRFLEKNIITSNLSENIMKMILYKLLKTIIEKIYLINMNYSLKGFEGTLIMFTYLNDYKIFNFNNKKILTKINCKKKYESIKGAAVRFNGFFNTTFINFSDVAQYYIESYIDFKPHFQWSNDDKKVIIERIFKIYRYYFETIRKNNNTYVSLKYKIEKWKDKDFIHCSGIADLNLSKIIHLTVPAIPLHKDLHIENVLFYQNEVYFIDFEHNGIAIFFDDIFRFVFSEHAEDFYLKNYLKGEYDEYFEVLFEIFGLNYDNKCRKEYILISQIERGCNEKQICQLLEKFVELN